MLSTGQEFDGSLLRDDGLRLSVKGPKRNSLFYAANVVQFTVMFKDESIPERDMLGIPKGRYAEFLLGKGYRFLAESMLLCALTRTISTNSGGEMTLELWAMERVLARRAVTDAQARAYKALYDKTRQKQPVRLGGAKSRTWRPRRYELPSAIEIKSAVAKRDHWAGRMKQIADKTHEIETAHFLIYSSWSKSDDARLKEIYEKLYVALCKQFDLPPTENIWIGKLPVFAFWRKEEFVEFCVKVGGTSPEKAKKAGGFAGNRGSFHYVNIGPVMVRGMSKTQARTWFYKILAHESTHAFLKRYISGERVVSWLNEGIAEMLADTLAPNSGRYRGLKAAREAVRKKGDSSFLPMLSAKRIPMDSASYGAAQSLVRFLVSKDKSKFIQLVHKIKSGASDEKALSEAYELTHEELLQQWSRNIR